jgi:hypothetical protein
MKYIKISFILALTTVLMSSCLKGDDSYTTLYDDAAITAFTLGTMNKYIDGSKTTYSGSGYGFNIDQTVSKHVFKDTTIIARSVFNRDSLPLGTDLQHVLATIITRNNSIAIIERLDQPNVYDYFTSSDSIDFTKPRKVRVISSDGEVFNDYYISVDAHQEDGNEFVWHLMEENWQPEPAAETNLPEGIKQLLGGCTTEQYAWSTDNKLMVSYDKGVNWVEEAITDDADMMPTRDLALISYPMNNVDSIDYVLLVGNREVNEQNKESIAMVWRKVVDYSKNAPYPTWTYMERNSTKGDSLALPRIKDLTVVKYDDGILALGGAGIGGCEYSPYVNIFQSRDNGITWKWNSRYVLPEDFDYNATKVTASVDEDNFIWLHCEGTGQVWRGRLNKLGWKNQK